MKRQAQQLNPHETRWRPGAEGYVDPRRFAPQVIEGSPGGGAYARAATQASLDAVRSGAQPVRVTYGADPAHVLDVFAPEAAENLPVVVFLHGGAWTAGYPWWCGFMAPGILALPAILVTPAYRLAPSFRFPAALEDVRNALRWVRENIREFGGDRERVIVGGHSAGGHLAALAMLSRDDAEDGVVGCVPLSSSFDLRYPNAAPGSGEERVYRYLFADRADDARASPILHAQRARVPFAVVIGEHDFPRVDRTSRAFCAALEANGADCRLAVWPGLDHFAVHLALRDPHHAWYGETARLLGVRGRQPGGMGKSN